MGYHALGWVSLSMGKRGRQLSQIGLDQGGDYPDRGFRCPVLGTDHTGAVSAAAKRTVLLAVSVAVLGAVAVAGSAGGASWKRDRIPPTAPTNLHVEAATPTWVLTGWDPSQDNVGVAGYQVFTETGRATVSSPRYMVGDLGCGASTTISVVAFDRAGNRSSRVPATVATTACPDNQPPSTPSGFRQAATAQDAVVLAWNPSGDDTGVVGYGVYRNVVQIAAPTDPTVTLNGLACGSTYTYGVDAVDAAGNRSLLGTAYVQTASCSDGHPPSAPADLAVTDRTQTSISISWSASSDDIGVAGYRVRVDGTTRYNGTQTSATLSDLACGMTYAIGVTAYDAAGNQSTGSSTSAATAALLDASTSAFGRHEPALDAQKPDDLGCDGHELRHVVEPGYGQRRGYGLQRLSGRREARNGGNDVVCVHGPRVRNDLYGRARGIRRRRQRLQPSGGDRSCVDACLQRSSRRRLRLRLRLQGIRPLPLRRRASPSRVSRGRASR